MEVFVLASDDGNMQTVSTQQFCNACVTTRQNNNLNTLLHSGLWLSQQAMKDCKESGILPSPEATGLCRGRPPWATNLAALNNGALGVTALAERNDDSWNDIVSEVEKNSGFVGHQLDPKM